MHSFDGRIARSVPKGLVELVEHVSRHGIDFRSVERHGHNCICDGNAQRFPVLLQRRHGADRFDSLTIVTYIVFVAYLFFASMFE